MQDRPTAEELLEAVRAFLAETVLPRLEGRERFHCRVAVNLLDIVARERRLGGDHEQAEWERLDALLGPEPPPPDPEARRARLRTRTEALCERIRAGDADHGPFRTAVLAHVRQTVEEKLAVANPRLLPAAGSPEG